MQLLCSTGAFGRHPILIDHHDIITYAPLLPVDGLELMYYPEWGPTIEQIAAGLQASGLRFPALHVEKNAGPALASVDAAERARGRGWLIDSCRLGQLLGTQVAVFHLWGAPGSDEYIERNLAVLDDCVKIAEDYGLTLAVETIPCLKSTPLDVIQRVLATNERCGIALDTEFLAIHGQIEATLNADWLWSTQRVCHVHLKDYDGNQYTSDNYRRYLHPGEGNLDFPAFFARLRQLGFTGNFSLEASVVNPDKSIDIAKLQNSLSNLRTLINATGNEAKTQQKTFL